MEDNMFSYEEIVNLIKEDIKKESRFCYQDLVEYTHSADRQLFIEEIVGGTGSAVDNMIRFWNTEDDKAGIPIEERKPIKLYIDSPGGSLLDTFTIIDSMSMSKTPVWTICTGTAYSGGFFIFIAGARRIAYPHASFLFHEGSITSVSGTANQFANYSNFYKRQLKMLKDITLQYTNITEEKYAEIQNEDFWLSAKEATELGICDEIAKEFV
jgi:ATP-dependent Clp protease protease subunit